jgi:hypothetical protein
LTSPDGIAGSGELLVIPELYGRVTLLDAEDRLVAHLGKDQGASRAVEGWPDKNILKPCKFNSPHGAGADASGNVFIVEWRAGGRIIKLEKR